METHPEGGGDPSPHCLFLNQDREGLKKNKLLVERNVELGLKLGRGRISSTKLVFDGPPSLHVPVKLPDYLLLPLRELTDQDGDASLANSRGLAQGKGEFTMGEVETDTHTHAPEREIGSASA